MFSMSFNFVSNAAIFSSFWSGAGSPDRIRPSSFPSFRFSGTVFVQNQLIRNSYTADIWLITTAPRAFWGMRERNKTRRTHSIGSIRCRLEGLIFSRISLKGGLPMKDVSDRITTKRPNSSIHLRHHRPIIPGFELLVNQGLACHSEVKHVRDVQDLLKGQVGECPTPHLTHGLGCRQCGNRHHHRLQLA